MQLEFFFRPERPLPPPSEGIKIGTRWVPLQWVRNRRARRYILRVQPDGTVRLTLPRGGTRNEGRAFAERNRNWIEKQLQNPPVQFQPQPPWTAGTEILFRGEPVNLEVIPPLNGRGKATILFADQTVHTDCSTGDLRPVIEQHLRQVAGRELMVRTWDFAWQYRLRVRRVTIRDQRTRWGSCSSRGTVSLNWRLIQTPSLVQDYIILHELMHLKQMNHSQRFWRLVAQVCPRYEEAEAWLKKFSSQLR